MKGSKFYCEGLGFEPTAIWNNEGGRAMMLEMGRATLDLFDETQAEVIARIEAGRRLSRPVRLALQVTDLQAARQRLLTHGATLVHPPVTTPWGDTNVVSWSRANYFGDPADLSYDLSTSYYYHPIGPQAFEVGSEVRETFLGQHPEADTAFFPSPASAPGKWLADIYQLARIRLERAGVQAIYGGGRCTVTESESFYSYRRDGVTGRMASLIWLV